MITPGRTLAFICVAWLALTLAIAAATPAWEANDEPDHVRNVERFVAGSWYRIEPGAGFESHQAPLYYLAVAAYQKALRLHAFEPAPPLLPAEAGTAHGIFEHAVPGAGLDQRRVLLLRLFGVGLGLLTILLTFFAGSRLSADRWTPVVGAALVAGVPKFAFLSGVVNNDNLANTLGALAVLLIVLALGGARHAASKVPYWRLAAALGAVGGGLLLAKLPTLTVLPVLLAAAVLGAPRGERLKGCGAFAAALLVVCGWWFVQNQVRYGDPLALTATHDHLIALFPPLFDVADPARRIFVEIPQGVWRSFWYTSGWNQFLWSSWTLHLPLWLALFGGITALGVFRARPWPAPVRTIIALAAFALGAVAAVWILGVQTSQTQARVAFFGLPAIGLLFALGVERARLWIPLRFVLPLAGFLGAIVALQRDVIGVYF